jgi:hypothetical protein
VGIEKRNRRSLHYASLRSGWQFCCGGAGISRGSSCGYNRIVIPTGAKRSGGTCGSFPPVLAHPLQPLKATVPGPTHPYYHSANFFLAGSGAVAGTAFTSVAAHFIICTENSDLLSGVSGSPILMD